MCCGAEARQAENANWKWGGTHTNANCKTEIQMYLSECQTQGQAVSRKLQLPLQMLLLDMWKSGLNKLCHCVWLNMANNSNNKSQMSSSNGLLLTNCCCVLAKRLSPSASCKLGLPRRWHIYQNLSIRWISMVFAIFVCPPVWPGSRSWR